MAEQATHTGGTEQEGETLSAEDYLNLLKILKINLPKGVLKEEVVTKSTHPTVIEDARHIKQDLEKCTIQFAQTPRLACGDIEQALKLRENNKYDEITNMMFFRNFKDSNKKTPTKEWKKKLTAGCGFQLKKTYQETSSHPRESTGLKWYGNHRENKINAEDCLSFYLEQKGLTPADINTKRNTKLEFGFLSGKPNFLVDIKISPTEKLIIKCNSASGNIDDICTTPNEGSQAQFKTSHQFYLQAQAYLFILNEKEKMEDNPVPVRAVIVLKVKPTEKIYWSEVNEDTENIKQLNDFCINEALPRFLAVLNLIFEKENYNLCVRD